FCVGTPVIWFILYAKGTFTEKVVSFVTAVLIIVTLTLTEHYLRRNDQSAKMFLAETLFVFHAKIIHAQMAADLKNGQTDIYPREWLGAACADLGRDVERAHILYPDKFPALGFHPSFLMFDADPLPSCWQHQLGD